jgi:membrane protease YdiL (CAAX protease family)
MLIIGVLVGQAFHFLYPTLKTEYENQNLFRPWNDPIMSFYYAELFLVGIILAWIWEFTKSIAKGENPLEKGFYFGLIYWVITLPGMLMSCSSFPVSQLFHCNKSI